MENILILNSGSSTVKFKIFDNNTDQELVDGVVDRIGLNESFIKLATNSEEIKIEIDIPNHTVGFKEMFNLLQEKQIIKDLKDIIKVGHRVVQGGEYFKKSSLVQEEELAKIKELAVLAPLHNIPNSQGIEVVQELLPHVKNIAVFDTEFHQTMPPESYLYGVPYSWYEKYQVRRYGAHGTSFKYITNKCAEIRGVKKEDQNIIVCHLGNGASINAIKGGKSFQTTMGMTPLDGIIMGTRSGSIDPAIVNYMCQRTGKTVEEITNDLNFKSGMLGLTEKSSDFRDIIKGLAEGDSKVKKALDVYITKIIEVIGSYYFRLGGIDAIVFTAGVGENTEIVREKIAESLEFLGVKFDQEANKKKATYITTKDSKIDLMIIPTNEELQILKETKEF